MKSSILNLNLQYSFVLSDITDHNDGNNNTNNNNNFSRPGNTGLMSSGAWSRFMGRGIPFSLG